MQFIIFVLRMIVFQPTLCSVVAKKASILARVNDLYYDTFARIYETNWKNRQACKDMFVINQQQHFIIRVWHIMCNTHCFRWKNLIKNTLISFCLLCFLYKNCLFIITIRYSYVFCHNCFLNNFLCIFVKCKFLYYVYLWRILFIIQIWLNAQLKRR